MENSAQKTRVVFFGSPADVVCVLDSLIAGGYDVVSVYTRSGKRTGRGSGISPTAVAAAAKKAGIPVISPAHFDTAVCESLRALQPDLFVTAAFGRILPKSVLEIPKFGTINLHPSLLPKYRGASPVANAILADEEATGLTFMLVNESLDGGDVIAQTDAVKIGGETNRIELQTALFEEGARKLPHIVKNWISGKIVSQVQDETLATHTKTLTKEDGMIDWNLPAAHLERMTRAYVGWPGTYTSWNGNMLKLIETRLSAVTLEVGEVGFLNGSIHIGCGEGALQVNMLQVGSRNAVTASDAINGYPQLNGSRL